MTSDSWTKRTSDEGTVVSFARNDTEAEWARSEWPHPLLTLDFDADDRLIGIEAVGSIASALGA